MNNDDDDDRHKDDRHKVAHLIQPYPIINRYEPRYESDIHFVYLTTNQLFRGINLVQPDSPLPDLTQPNTIGIDTLTSIDFWSNIEYHLSLIDAALFIDPDESLTLYQQFIYPYNFIANIRFIINNRVPQGFRVSNNRLFFYIIRHITSIEDVVNHPPPAPGIPPPPPPPAPGIPPPPPPPAPGTPPPPAPRFGGYKIKTKKSKKSKTKSKKSKTKKSKTKSKKSKK
jgi:hypothetical protein